MRVSSSLGCLVLFCAVALSSGNALGQTEFWQATNGPMKGVYGATNSFGEVYVISDHLWRSSDRGSHWKDVTGTLPSGKISNITIAPDNTMFVIAGDVYRSTDLGDSWTNILTGYTFVDLTATASDTVYVAVSTGSVGPILYSHDNGISWSSPHGVISEPSSVTHLCRTPAGVLILDVGSYFYRSMDNGLSWSKQINNLFAGNGISVATKSGVLFTASPYGVARSTDNARTWTTLFPDAGTVVGAGADSILIFKSQYEYVNGSYVIVDSLYTSTDGGISWSGVIPHVQDILDGVDLPRSGSYFDHEARVLMCGGGYSHPKVYVWTTALSDPITYTIPNTTVHAILSTAPGVIYANTEETFRGSSDGGDHWALLSSGYQPTGGDIWYLGQDSSHNLLGAKGSAVYISSDSGATWSYLLSHVNPSSTEIKFFTAPNGTLFISSPQSGLIRTSDHGLTWDLLAQEFLTTRIAVLNCDIHGNLYIGISTPNLPGNIYRSTDNGDTWHQSLAVGFSSLPDLSSISMTSIVPTADGGMELSTSDHGMLHVSADGQQWNYDNVGLDGDHVASMQNTTSGDLYAWSWQGQQQPSMIFRPNGAKRWLRGPALTGILYRDISAWTVSPDGTIYLGTFGKGIWKSHGPLDGVESHQNSQALHIVLSPNPAQRQSTLRIENTQNSDAEISVFDELGRIWIHRIEKATDESAIVTGLDLSQLPRGSYCVQVKSGRNSVNAHCIVQ